MRKEIVIQNYLSSIGRKGGKKSRRVLTSEQARQMVRIREARRAFKKFHARCFWSYDPDYQIKKNDILWVAKMLMRHGGQEGWKLGEKLCL